MMMSRSIPDFDQRLKRVESRARRLAQDGSYTKMDRSGLVREYPRSRLPTFPWSMLVLLLLGALAFKAWLYVALGAARYSATLELLSEGSLSERIGAFIMQPEPLTQALASAFTAWF